MQVMFLLALWLGLAPAGPAAACSPEQIVTILGHTLCLGNVPMSVHCDAMLPMPSSLQALAEVPIVPANAIVPAPVPFSIVPELRAEIGQAADRVRKVGTALHRGLPATHHEFRRPHS